MGITVVIPVWGAYTQWLPECLRSLRQPGIDQILVVDNACEPHLEADDLGCELLRLSNRVSVGQARNRGLEQVHTDWVMFFDADDELLPGTAQHLLAQCQPGDVAVSAAWVGWLPEQDFRADWGWPMPFDDRTLTRAYYPLLCHWRSVHPTVGATLLRTDLVRAAGGFDDSNAGEDWVLAAALSYRGRVRMSRRPGRLYRIHSASLHLAAYDHPPQAPSALRARLRNDRSAPIWLRACLPLLAIAHSRQSRRRKAKADSSHARWLGWP